MEQKNWNVGGRQFRTEKDYRMALRDREIIEKLKTRLSTADISEYKRVIDTIKAGKIQFMTLLGQDFLEELEEEIDRRSTLVSVGSKTAKGKAKVLLDEKQLQQDVEQELHKQEKRRRKIMGLCALLGVIFLGVFGLNQYGEYINDSRNLEYRSELQQSDEAQGSDKSQKDSRGEIYGPQFTLDTPSEAKTVLEEYKNLLNKYPDLIGWLKIADTNIDYPVMQTSDNEYYLDHDLDGKLNKNGTLFLDKDCDVMDVSTNLILYGHHMKSGKMFGSLVKYEKKDYYEKHKYIQFDTIYEKGTYEVMYVFRSKVYKEDEITFKYYQFIEANGETEFQSNMDEMAAMSLYSTGVTAQYGDELLTLSTCDYEEKDGRFVVVAKKIPTKE